MRELLRWIDKRFGYMCRPSDREKPNLAEDAVALEAFHRQYNDDVPKLGSSLAPAYASKVKDGPVATDDTWRAFFDIYQRYLTSRLGLTMTELGDGSRNSALNRSGKSAAPK